MQNKINDRVVCEQSRIEDDKDPGGKKGEIDQEVQRKEDQRHIHYPGAE